MNTTVKGIRQELLYSDKSFLLSEFFMPSQAHSFRKIKEIVTVHAGTWHLLSGCAPETEFCEQQQKFDIGAAVQNVRRLFMV